jgi:hypothetical protein
VLQTSVVTTVDQPQQEAAIKGAQKVHTWVTDLYVDWAHREAGQEVQGAVKTAGNGSAVPSVLTEVVIQEKVEDDEEDANEKASEGGIGHTQTDSSSPMGHTPQQVHMDEEVLQQVVRTDDNQCHHKHQQKKLNKVGAQHAAEGTDHTLQLHGVPILEQQMGETNRNSCKNNNNLLLQVTKGQHDDPFLCDILRYLHDHTLPNKTRRT